MGQYYGIDYLRRKRIAKETRVAIRYKYYEMKNEVEDFNIVIPAKWSWLSACLGWCGKAVDSVSDRLIFREFDNDILKMNTIYDYNSSDVLFDSAVLSACVSSCCFIYISPDPSDNFPRLQVIDGGNATGIIDPITYLLKEGYAILERDVQTGLPTLEAYFIKGRTDFYKNGKYAFSKKSAAPAPLLVPVIYRPDAVRPFGHSRISRACMKIQQAALRTIKRAEVSAEFYSFPQKYITGLSQDAELLDKWNATISSFLQFDKDEEGDKPSLGQFTQQSMAPFMEQMKLYASLFGSETGLTLDDLGFPSDNPSSSEAIKATHETLRLTARKAQRTFGVGFLNAGYLAACLRDDFPYKRRILFEVIPKWEPIFEPDSSQLAGIGDAIGKIQSAFPNYFTADKLKDITGI